jgi:hypothetical protein
MPDTLAIIIPFPKKDKPLIVRRSADLFHAWDKKLINPKLRKIYKPEISWLERWYLESRHLANNEQWDHPIIRLITYDADFNKFLRDCCMADIRLMEKLSDDPIYRDSSVRQRKKLIIWHNKFASFILNQETNIPG